MRKRLFSLLLVLAMVLSLGSVAFAAAATPTVLNKEVVYAAVNNEMCRSVVTATGPSSSNWYMSTDVLPDNTNTGLVQVASITVNNLTVAMTGGSTAKTITVSGTPAKMGDYKVYVKAANGTVTNFVIKVVAASNAKPPVFTIKKADATKLFNDPDNDYTIKYNEDITNVSFDVDSMVAMKGWKVDGLPEGLSWDNTLGDNIIRFTGRPTVAVKNQNVTVTATNKKGASSLQFKISVPYEEDLQWAYDGTTMTPTGTSNTVAASNYATEIDTNLSNDHKVGDQISDSAPVDGTTTANTTNSDIVFRAVPGPITWTYKNLPTGIKATVSGDTDLVLTGTFTKMSEFDSDGELKKNLIITAKNAAVDGEKTLTKEFAVKVWDKPQITTSTIPALQAEKDVKIKLDVKNAPIKTWKIMAMGKDDNSSSDIVAAPVTIKTSDDTAAGVLSFNVSSQTIVGSMDAFPNGDKIKLTVKVGNPYTGTTESKLVTKSFTVDFKGIAPTLASVTPTLTDSKNTLSFDIAKGTPPIALKAYIDAASAKTLGIGNGKSRVEIDNTGIAKLGLKFEQPNSNNASADNQYSGVLTYTPDVTTVDYASYKGIGLTIEASNGATGTKPVSKTFKLNLNPDNAAAWYDEEDDKLGSAYTPEDALTHGTAMNAATFTLSGDKPLTITSPKDGYEVNGLTATVTQPGDGEAVSANAKVEISGTPTEKKNTSFTLTAENPLTKKKFTTKVTFTVAANENVATEKPVFTAPSTLDMAGTGDTLVFKVGPKKAMPLENNVGDWTATDSGIKAYVAAKDAKALFGIENDIDLINDAAAIGLTAAVANMDSQNSEGTITLTANVADADFQSYKGLPITFEAQNYVTSNDAKKPGEPVVKTFKINVSKDADVAWSDGTNMLTGTVTIPASVDEAIAATGATGTNTKGATVSLAGLTFTLSGAKPLTMTAPTADSSTNGIETEVDTNAGTFKISGIPTKKGKINFTLTGENKVAKKKASLKVVIDVQEPKAATTEKLLVDKPADGVLDITKDKQELVFKINGKPASVDVVIEKASAKAIFGETDEIALLKAGENATADDVTTMTGFTFTPIVADAKGTGKLKYTYNDTVTATSYKGLKLKITAQRAAGTKVEKVEKSFNINLNPDSTPQWYKKAAQADKVKDNIVYETIKATTVDKLAGDDKPIPAGVALDFDDDEDLDFNVTLEKPFKITVNGKEITEATTEIENGITITSADSGVSTDFGLAKGVKLTIGGIPTELKDTTTKLKFEATNTLTKKKAVMNVTLSAFAQPTVTNLSELRKGKTVEAGKAVSIKPKIASSKKLELSFDVVAAADATILVNCGLSLDQKTGEIYGAAGETMPTLSAQGATGEYEPKTVSIKVTNKVEDSDGDNEVTIEDIKIDIKPKEPKVKTSKIVYWLDDDAHEGDNEAALIEISNITKAELSQDNGNSAAYLAIEDQSAFTEATGGVLAVSEDNGSKLPILYLSTAPTKAVYKKNFTIKVKNFDQVATKAVTITVNDLAPVFTADNSSVTLAPTKKAAATETVTLTVNTGYTADVTTFKWKISSKPDTGVTAKIAPVSGKPNQATLTLTAKKGLKEAVSTTVGVTVTNSQSKEESDEVEITVSANAATDDTALPEDSTALPEDTTATPEDTTALPDEDVESLLPKDRMLGEGDVKLGNERTADTITDEELRQIEAILGEGYEIAAILPEVTVTADGQYDLIIDLNDKASGDVATEEEAEAEKKLAGKELVWFAFPRDVEPSEDDEIVDFYDMEGHDTKVVPESNEFVASPWFEEGIVYAPVIAVKSDNGVTEQELAGVDSADKVVEIKTTDPKVEIITEDSEDENVEESEEETEVELELE
ncbi:MAG: hypothetical protein II960_02250 [Synergistaceae bacterium]|nr:hypothetical protein [Synergistaceae bacterium]